MTEVADGTLKGPGTGQAPHRSTRGLHPWGLGCLASLLSALVCLCSTWTRQWPGLRGDVVLSAGQPGEIRRWLVRRTQGAPLPGSIRGPGPSSLGDDGLQTRLGFLPRSTVLERETDCCRAANVVNPVAQSGASA